MRRPRITFRVMRLLKMLLPVVLVVALATVGASVWLAYWLAKPPVRAFLVTPETFSHGNDRAAKITDETWTNKDGTQAHGWLLRGSVGGPAVVLLHRYGADRSWLLNMGVKLNEGTNFTILWPDLRGHGESATQKWTTFGTSEADDTSAAVEYLGTLKSTQGETLVGEHIGIYGVELGGYAALIAATRDTGVRSLALDSIPATPDQLVRTVARERTGFDSGLVYLLSRGGMRLYLFRKYKNDSACVAANSLRDRHVLLLAGSGEGVLHDSTMALGHCFPDQTSVDVNSDLLVTGFNVSTPTSQESEAYDRKVIEFFDKSLRAKP